MGYDWSDRLGEAGWPAVLALLLLTGAWSAINDAREGFAHGERRVVPSGVAVGFTVGGLLQAVHAVAIVVSALAMR